MLMKYGGMLFRDCFQKNHTLSEMILLRGELGRNTFAFDVGSRALEYICTSPPPPKNKYDKLHSTFSKHINWEKITEDS